MEKQSASAYFARDITWTLCNACNPTFYWPVRCTPCSCRVCHTRQKKYSFQIDCNIFFWRAVVSCFGM